jgi:serine/threonine protein phosphatase PrpC
VAIVCDGVSSSARPDEASETAAEVAAESLMTALHTHNSSPAAATRQAIRAADKAVTALADSNSPGRKAPACTLVSAVVDDHTVTVGWVGDSRAYWIPLTNTNSTPTRLTIDDSWLAQVVETGALSPAQAAADRRAHAITAWLGENGQQIDPHIITIKPDGPGVVVICTDGLWTYLDTVEKFAAAIPAHALQNPLTAARQLVEIALRAGGRDNVTVAVVPFTSALPMLQSSRTH